MCSLELSQLEHWHKNHQLSLTFSDRTTEETPDSPKTWSGPWSVHWLACWSVRSKFQNRRTLYTNSHTNNVPQASHMHSVLLHMMVKLRYGQCSPISTCGKLWGFCFHNRMSFFFMTSASWFPTNANKNLYTFHSQPFRCFLKTTALFHVYSRKSSTKKLPVIKRRISVHGHINQHEDSI